jgi:hypothetical protein
MKATKLVLAGIAIAVCVIFVLGTLHNHSKYKSAAQQHDSGKVSFTRRGMMAEPLSMAFKLTH